MIEDKKKSGADTTQFEAQLAEAKKKFEEAKNAGNKEVAERALRTSAKIVEQIRTTIRERQQDSAIDGAKMTQREKRIQEIRNTMDKVKTVSETRNEVNRR